MRRAGGAGRDAPNDQGSGQTAAAARNDDWQAALLICSINKHTVAWQDLPYTQRNLLRHRLRTQQLSEARPREKRSCSSGFDPHRSAMNHLAPPQQGRYRALTVTAQEAAKRTAPSMPSAQKSCTNHRHVADGLLRQAGEGLSIGALPADFGLPHKATLRHSPPHASGSPANSPCWHLMADWVRETGIAVKT